MNYLTLMDKQIAYITQECILLVSLNKLPVLVTDNGKLTMTTKWIDKGVEQCFNEGIELLTHLRVLRNELQMTEEQMDNGKAKDKSEVYEMSCLRSDQIIRAME